MVTAEQFFPIKESTSDKGMKKAFIFRNILLLSFLLGGQTLSAKSIKYNFLTFNVTNQDKEEKSMPWTDRSTLICKALRGLHPDVIALQDADSIQFADLTQGLPEYATATGGTHKANINPILYNPERLSVISGGVHDITTHENVSIPGQEGQTIASVRWVFLQDKKEGGSMLVVNTQLQESEERFLINGITQLKTFLGKMTNQTPILLAGDFLNTDEHPFYNILCSHFIKLNDCWKQAKKAKGQPSTFNNFQEESQDRIVDFIFASEDFGVKSAQITKAQKAGQYYSCHNILSSEVILKK